MIVASFLAAPVLRAEAASARLLAARAADAELRADEKKLRFRHHIQRVIRLWKEARSAADGEDRRAARRGEAEAWALMAHWSGRADDAARAKKLRAALVAKPPRAPKRRARPASAKGDAPGWLTRVAHRAKGGRIALTFEVSRAFSIRRDVLPPKRGKPTRVYFDLTPVVAAREVLGSIDVQHEAVLRVRLGQFDADTARLVIDVAGGRPEAEAVYAEDQRIVLAFRDAGGDAPPTEPDAEDPKTAVARLRETLAALTDERDGPESSPSRAAPLKIAPAKEVFPDARLRRSTRAAATPRGASILRVRRIVIDPGHGGKDRGASGKNRLREKDVNLAIARALGEALQKRLDVDVIFTRTKDRFVSLDERARAANRARGDLFISIHANANRSRRVRGIETYHLDVTSSRYARRLAKRENSLEAGTGDVPEPGDTEEVRASLDEMLPAGALGRDLRLILADLAMRSATVESRRLAGYVQSAAVGVLGRHYPDVRDLGVKRALFYVLLAARMPAILVETGFVTSPREAERLRDPTYQTRLADAIALGVERFVRERQQLALATVP